MDIRGHAALVAGGASGLGEATARRMAAAGARVAVLDFDLARAEAVARAIGGVAVQADVTSAEGVAAALAAAHERHGPARICVNCAGIDLPRRIVGRDGPMPLETFERVISVNLVGTFNVMRLAAADMVGLEPVNETGERGVVINTASAAAFEGQVGQASYSASKGGIVALTLPAAREFGRFGVRVVTIAPGLMETPMWEGAPEEMKSALARQAPFPQRFGTSDEFAALALHVMDNAMLNGEVIRLDGGLRMNGQ